MRSVCEVCGSGQTDRRRVGLGRLIGLRPLTLSEHSSMVKVLGMLLVEGGCNPPLIGLQWIGGCRMAVNMGLSVIISIHC